MEDIRFGGNSEFSVNKVGFVSVMRDENFTFEYKNGKELNSFIYVENGELEFYFYETKKRIKTEKGTLLFIPKAFPYKTKYLKNKTKIKTIIFDLSRTDVSFCSSLPFHKISPDIRKIFSSISSYNANHILFLISKIYEIFYCIQNEGLNISSKYKKILPAINEITNKYFENRKICYYADMCDMSESNFRKVFKEYKGVSPIEYRNILRCAEVSKMLNSGEFTVTEAAFLVGFNNMSFFYEAYNKYKKSASTALG
ncbi:MAG: helix-turn-helix domain-containing protein [Clostridia bacterium]|nr:helix-turn-helix domain-containing protein [Clostridia bacterium]